MESMPRPSQQQLAEKEDLSRAFVDSLDALIGRFIVNSPRGLHPVDVSPQESRSLIWLGRNHSCVMSEFARGLAVPLSTATHMVDRLVEKGLLVRKRSKQDRRIVMISLSRLGKRLDQRFYEHRLTRSRKLLGALGTVDQKHLIRLMRKLVV
jgi:DNA-binding MarR family transcriptional regulator